MSHSIKNNSQISSDKIKFDREDPALHDQLARIFTKVVSGKISTLLQASQEVKPEDHAKNDTATSDNVTEITAPENLAAAQKSTYKGKNTVVSQWHDVSFEVPEDSIAAKIKMDSIAEINPNCQSSFAERLKGWDIERRQHVKNMPKQRIDSFFRHLKSRRQFRSIVEVVDYILYEVYPRNPKKDQLLTLEEDVIKEMLGVNPNGESSSVCDEREKAQRQKEFVEKFLRESWLNLMNTKETRRDNEQEKHENFSNADAEEMQETFYNKMQENESFGSETDEETKEFIFNNAIPIKRARKDNDGKERASAAREQVQGTPSETQASNKDT